MIGSIAEEAGLEVLAADNGREGLAAVIQHEPDCIITDLLMPEMNGLDMIEALQEEGWNTPFIVVSADVQDTTTRARRATWSGVLPRKARAEGIRYRGLGHLLRWRCCNPIDKAELLHAIASSIQSSGSSSSAHRVRETA
ncbi:MAG: response regulator [Gemmatimonadota bacterium]|nr:response regulator [Gemmatimonadota bacterium]